MNRHPYILIVAHTPSVAKALYTWFSEAGYEAVIVTSFAAAKVHLDADPDLLVSELRLGDYNGLHLGLKARTRGIPAVVMSDADPVLEREAEQMGVVYVPSNPDRRRMLALVGRLLSEFGKRRVVPMTSEAPAPMLSLIPSAEFDLAATPSSSWYYAEGQWGQMPPN